MLDGDVFTHLKKFNTVLEVAYEFVSLLNHLLDNAEKSGYVNADEVPAIKPKASLTAKKALVMETPVGRQPLACNVQAK